MVRRHSYANVVSTLALIVATGGTTAYAAAQITSKDIKDNAIKSVDIKDRQIRSVDLKDGSLLAVDFAAGELAAGVTGGTLPAGATLRGVYATGGSGDSDIDRQGITFVVPLASAPTAHYVALGDTAPAQCPGNANSPAAAPGHLCVYETTQLNLAQRGIFDPVSGFIYQSSRFGFGIFTDASTTGFFAADGSWAVTAGD